MNIYKPTYTTPIPKSAEIVTVQGRRCARWRSRGRAVTAQLTECGTRCIRESGVYWMRYRDERGHLCLAKLCRDRRAAEKMGQDLLTAVDRRAAGLPTEILAEHRRESLADWVEKFFAYLSDQGRDLRYLHGRRLAVERTIAGVGVAGLADLTPEAVMSYIASRRNSQTHNDRMSTENANKYIIITKAFTNYVADRLSVRDPLEKLKCMRRVEKTRQNRALTIDELGKLIANTRDRGLARLQKLDRESRAMLYLIAALTGYRAGELAKLRAENFTFSDDTCRVSLPGSGTKNKRNADIPLPRPLVPIVAAWLAGRDVCWPGNWTAAAYKMFARDLAAAGIEANSGGGKITFHGLRHTYVSLMAASGVLPAFAQKFSRHNDPRLTFDTYLHLQNASEQAEIDKLPAESLVSVLVAKSAKTNAN